jgi:hypothetical protein
MAKYLNRLVMSQFGKLYPDDVFGQESGHILRRILPGLTAKD